MNFSDFKQNFAPDIFATFPVFLTLALHVQTPAKWVSLFIGTTNYGATNQRAIVPRGMVSVIPFNVSGNSIFSKSNV